MMNPHVIDWLLFASPWLIGFLIGAALLRTACILYNLLVAALVAPDGRLPAMDLSRENRHGSETGITTEPSRTSALETGDKPNEDNSDRIRVVPKIGYGQALGILFLSSIVAALAGFLAAKFAGGFKLTSLDNPADIPPIAYLVALAVSILAIGTLLPTSFGKGVLVALLHALLWIVFIIVAGFVLFFLGAGYAVISRIGG